MNKICACTWFQSLSIEVTKLFLLKLGSELQSLVISCSENINKIHTEVTSSEIFPQSGMQK